MAIWFEGQGPCPFSEGLEMGLFVWPGATEGKMAVAPAQMAMLLDGIDRRAPARTSRPLRTG